MYHKADSGRKYTIICIYIGLDSNPQPGGYESDVLLTGATPDAKYILRQVKKTKQVHFILSKKRLSSTNLTRHQYLNL